MANNNIEESEPVKWSEAKQFASVYQESIIKMKPKERDIFLNGEWKLDEGDCHG